MRGERRGMAGTLRTPLIIWDQITGVGIIACDEGPLPQPQPPMRPSSKPRFVSRGFCFVDAARQRGKRLGSHGHGNLPSGHSSTTKRMTATTAKVSATATTVCWFTNLPVTAAAPPAGNRTIFTAIRRASNNRPAHRSTVQEEPQARRFGDQWRACGSRSFPAAVIQARRCFALILLFSSLAPAASSTATITASVAV